MGDISLVSYSKRLPLRLSPESLAYIFGPLWKFYRQAVVYMRHATTLYKTVIKRSGFQINQWIKYFPSSGVSRKSSISVAQWAVAEKNGLLLWVRGPASHTEPHAVHTFAIWQLKIYFANEQFIWPCAVSKRLIKEWAFMNINMASRNSRTSNS